MRAESIKESLDTMKTMKKGGVNSNISKKHFLYILVYGKEFYHKLLAIRPH